MSTSEPAPPLPPPAYSVGSEPSSDESQPSRSRDWCCCLGMIGNTHYKCLGRGLDLGHCRSTDCPTYAECKERVAAMVNPTTAVGSGISRSLRAAVDAGQSPVGIER